MKKSKESAGRARQLRRIGTAAEGRLWNALRSRRLDGLKFRRQHPIGPLVVDFCCLDQALVVEIDGDVHAGREITDRIRTEKIEARGYLVIRFTNSEVMEALPTVLAEIHRAASRRAEASGEDSSYPHPHPLPSRERA